MASIANASSFLQTRAALSTEETTQNPETLLLNALDRHGVIPLPEVPKVLGMSPEQALPILTGMRNRSLVEVVELDNPKMAGVKFLRLK